MNEPRTEAARVADAFAPVPKAVKNYDRLRDMPPDVLATRVVASLIHAQGNLNEYAKVIEALVINIRAEYESPATGGGS